MKVLLTSEKQAPCRNWSKSEWVSFFLVITFILCFLASDIVPSILSFFSHLFANMLHLFTSIILFISLNS